MPRRVDHENGTVPPRALPEADGLLEAAAEVVGEHPVDEGVEAAVEVHHNGRDGRQEVEDAAPRLVDVPVVEQVAQVEGQHADGEDGDDGDEEADDPAPGRQAPLRADPTVRAEPPRGRPSTATPSHSTHTSSSSSPEVVAFPGPRGAPVASSVSSGAVAVVVVGGGHVAQLVGVLVRVLGPLGGALGEGVVVVVAGVAAVEAGAVPAGAGGPGAGPAVHTVEAGAGVALDGHHLHVAVDLPGLRGQQQPLGGVRVPSHAPAPDPAAPPSAPRSAPPGPPAPPPALLAFQQTVLAAAAR